MLAELRRRKVFKVATAYMVVGWVLLQVASLFFESFDAPDWVFRSFSVLIVLGFPVACLLAWAFEATPEGVIQSESAASVPPASRWTDYLWAVVIVATLAVAAVNLWHDWSDRSLSSPALATDPGVAAPGPSPRGPADDKGQLSIAVLPFENLSANEDNAYFASGVHEDILTHLSKLGGMKVISRTSVLQYADKSDKSLVDIGRELGVSHILEGSVRRAGDQVRITVQLIDAGNDAHLWSENYDRRLENIFQVQSEVAKQVAQQLHVELDSSALGRIETVPTSNIAAYDLYLKGRASPMDERGSREAIELLQQALIEDPEFSLAHAALADRFAHLVRLGQDWQAVREEALAHARKSLELDPLASEAHQAMGAIHWADERFKDAELEMRTAISLNPNSSGAYFALGQVLFYQGRFAESREAMHRTLELDPGNLDARSALSILYRNIDEQQDRGLDLLAEVMELAPDSVMTQLAAGTYAVGKGDLIGGYSHVARGVQADPDNLLAVNFLHFILLNVGRYELADAWLQHAMRVSPNSELTYQMRLNSLDASHSRAEKLVKPELIEAREQIVEAWLEHNPRSSQAYRYRGTLLSFRAAMQEAQGDMAGRDRYVGEAITALEQSLAPHLRPDGSYVYQEESAWALSGYGSNLIIIGRTGEGERVYRNILAALDESTPMWSDLHRSVSWSMLGDEKAALDALELAYDKGWHSTWIVESYPSLVAMGNNVRYIDIMARMHARNQGAHDYIGEHPAYPPQQEK